MIVEIAYKKYPINRVNIPDIDAGCPSWLTEDENAEKRHYYMLGLTDMLNLVVKCLDTKKDNIITQDLIDEITNQLK